MSYFQLFDTGELIRVTTTGRDAIRASIAYNRIILYFEAARRQQFRVHRLIQQHLASVSDPKRLRLLRRVFVEIHFYFIAWNAIEEMFEVLNRSSKLGCVKEIFRRHKLLFTQYRHGRDVLEHYQEMLPGGREVHTMRIPKDLGNLHGTHFTLGGERWDVGPHSIQKLKNIVDQLMKEVPREALAKYQAKIEDQPRVGVHGRKADPEPIPPAADGG